MNQEQPKPQTKEQEAEYQRRLEEFETELLKVEELISDIERETKITKSGGNKKYITKAKAKQKRKLQKKARKANR